MFAQIKTSSSKRMVYSLAATRFSNFQETADQLPCLMKHVKLAAYLLNPFGALPTNLRWICSPARQFFLQDAEFDATHLAGSCSRLASVDADLRDGFSSFNRPEKTLSLFFEARNCGFSIDDLQLVHAIKSCSSLLAINEGEQIHSFVTKAGFESDLYVRNGLINLYAKCGRIEIARGIFDMGLPLSLASWNTMICGYVKLGRMEDARNLFVEMPERDCVSWTTMIMGLDQSDDPVGAISMFGRMCTDAVRSNEVTIASVVSAFSRIGDVRGGRAIHATVVKLGFEFQVLVSTNLINMYIKYSNLDDACRLFDVIPCWNIVTLNVILNGYVKLGCVEDAERLFLNMPERDVVSWSAVIDGFLKAGQIQKAFEFYGRMQHDNVKPNKVTITNFLSICGDLLFLFEGQQLHGLVIKIGLDSYDFIHTTVIHMYAACGRMDLAHLQFVSGANRNISASNALIAGYVKHNRLDQARRIFDRMQNRDVVSWSSMVSGYAQSGQFEMALHLFYDMQKSGIRPNEITLVSVLSAISGSGDLRQGVWIHEYIYRNSIPLNDNLSAGLIDMYAKCGNINDALGLFHYIRNKCKSISPWNSIINGLAMHGYAEQSLSIFSDSQKIGLEPNSITFIGVLCACCHAGFVELGEAYFRSMTKQYRIQPNIKHYGCMVDLLGRAGRLEDAKELINSMPVKPDVVIWGSLLAACRSHGDVEMGEWAAKCLVDLEPSHGGGRVLLSNIYAGAGRWDEVHRIRRVMRRRKVQKLAAYSGVL
uniref:Pentacotripeptide-repeat region of PRORP domain-containing protein n=2 Tax=Nymphaea colorata TaxID=210225 RepID=A0A5K1GGY2_9MAGN